MYTVSPYLFLFPKIRAIYMPIKQIIAYTRAVIRIQITAANKARCPADRLYFVHIIYSKTYGYAWEEYKALTN